MEKTFLIDQFNGGISEDKRVTQANKFSITKHFDAHTYPKKLVPYHQTVTYSDGGATTALGITKFLFAPSTGGSFKLYGLGVNGSNKATVYSLDVSNIAVNTWGSPANNASSYIQLSDKCFIYYQNAILFWIDNGAGSQYLAKFDTTGGAFNDTYKTPTGGVATNVAQAVHHKADDIAYFFYDNYVASLNGATWNATALTLPTNIKIVSACEYGNYLAIGCQTLGTFGLKSIVYLWDRDSSLTTISQTIDFGSGALLKLANIDGNLIAIVNNKIGDTNDLFKGKYLIKRASGSFGITLNEITTDDGNAYLPTSGLPDGLVKDGKLYIAFGAGLNSDKRLGIWEIDGSGRFSLGYVESAATLYINGIFPIDNTWFVSYSNGSNNTIISHTDTTRTYSLTNPSVYESLIFNAGDTTADKKLVGVSVMTEALPAAATVVLKYRKDAETAWTQIYSDTVDNGLYHDSINIESSGATLPEFNEIQFQINSYGGAVITGLKFKVEFVNKGKY